MFLECQVPALDDTRQGHLSVMSSVKQTPQTAATEFAMVCHPLFLRPYGFLLSTGNRTMKANGCQQ